MVQCNLPPVLQRDESSTSDENFCGLSADSILHRKATRAFIRGLLHSNAPTDAHYGSLLDVARNNENKKAQSQAW